jgi:hypothetical protein
MGRATLLDCGDHDWISVQTSAKTRVPFANSENCRTDYVFRLNREIHEPMTTGFAPIIVFAFRRPIHTQNALDSLAANAEARHSTLYVYCDGAKPSASVEDLAAITEVRRIARHESRFGRTIVLERDSNLGLANSIVGGVTEVIQRHGRAIVVEDDLIVSPYFLKYMNDGLSRYRDNPRVGQIGACNFFACGPRYPPSFFVPVADCLGWATWVDRWQHFEPDAALLLDKLEKARLMHRFDLEGAFQMEQMLRSQIERRVDSWAIRWQAVCVLKDWWTLYPNRSMSNHIESQANTHASINIVPPLETEAIEYETISVEGDPAIMRALKRGYAGISNSDGTLNFGATRAWLRHLVPQWLQAQWRAWRAATSK